MQAARIVVFSRDGNGLPDIPAAVWNSRQVCTVGSFPALEFRGPGLVVTIVRLAVAGSNALTIVWAEAASRTALSSMLATISANVVKSWACNLNGTAIVSDSLEADNGAVATAVKAAWPAGWNLWSGGENRGTKDVSAPAAPTGQRCVLEWLA